MICCNCNQPLYPTDTIMCELNSTRMWHLSCPLTSTVDHPGHYGGDTTYEAIKVIEAWGLGFCLGNALKYISRAGKKGDRLEDLKKAQWYLSREIAKGGG